VTSWSASKAEFGHGLSAFHVESRAPFAVPRRIAGLAPASLLLRTLLAPQDILQRITDLRLLIL
jgi:hypothetical protein